MRISTNVSVENGEWKISHVYDEADVLKMCQEERNSGREGWLEHKEGKLIARVPRHRFFSDIELQMYQHHKGTDDKEANEWLNRWLAKYPEFRTTTGGRRGIL